MDQYEDDREMTEIEPSEPLGKARVTFDVPMPTIEQVTGEIARQLLASGNYRERSDIMKAVADKIDDLIGQIVTEKATKVIEGLLENPLQPTDAFGNPVGEKTSLNALLAARVSSWASDIVDRDGKPKMRDGYNSTSVASRIDWALGQIVSGEMKKLVDVEVTKIVGTLKAAATQNIAKQIAEKISSLVIK